MECYWYNWRFTDRIYAKGLSFHDNDTFGKPPLKQTSYMIGADRKENEHNCPQTDSDDSAKIPTPRWLGGGQKEKQSSHPLDFLMLRHFVTTNVRL